MKPLCVKIMKYYTHKKVWKNTGIFMVFLRVLDASTSAQGKNSLFLVDTYAIKLQDMPFLWNVKCILSTKMHKCDDLHVQWIWLHTDNYVNFNSDMAVNNVLEIRGISSRDELCDDHVGCGSTQEEQVDMPLKHGRVLPKLMLLTKPLNHSSTTALVRMMKRTL